jgi:hypothetical protein
MDGLRLSVTVRKEEENGKKEKDLPQAQDTQ